MNTLSHRLPAATGHRATHGRTFSERVLRTLILWHHRARSRAALRRLDDHLLRDIGLSRETAERVASKPFWRP